MALRKKQPVFTELSLDVVTLPRGVRSLTLQNFRSYHHKRVDLDRLQSVVITGPNGVGKTNILEAISWLSPGRGLRRATLWDVWNQEKSGQAQSGWGIHAVVQNEQVTTHIGTGIYQDPQGAFRRTVHIDRQPVRSVSQLNQYLTVQWLTPDMDRILVEDRTQRRQFLDRLVYAHDHTHAQRVTQYETALRERLKLLKMGRREPQWLESLEEKLSQLAVSIVASRLDLTHTLNQNHHWINAAFPACRLRLVGDIETALEQGHSATHVEAMLLDQFKANRDLDARLGQTHCGAQRSDLEVVFVDKNMPAAQCSTGEQKACLVGIVLTVCKILLQQDKPTPILLMDEVIAHFDATRRLHLFQALEELRIQAWMTGTDRAIFEQAECRAHYLSLDTQSQK